MIMSVAVAKAVVPTTRVGDASAEDSQENMAAEMRDSRYAGKMNYVKL